MLRTRNQRQASRPKALLPDGRRVNIDGEVSVALIQSGGERFVERYGHLPIEQLLLYAGRALRRYGNLQGMLVRRARASRLRKVIGVLSVGSAVLLLLLALFLGWQVWLPTVLVSSLILRSIISWLDRVANDVTSEVIDECLQCFFRDSNCTQCGESMIGSETTGTSARCRHCDTVIDADDLGVLLEELKIEPLPHELTTEDDGHRRSRQVQE